jgi:hypothetical protein
MKYDPWGTNNYNSQASPNLLFFFLHGLSPRANYTDRATAQSVIIIIIIIIII